MAFMADEFPMMLEVEAGQNPQYCPPVAVCFCHWAHKDDAKSLEAGHDVFVDIEYVRITIPGERSSLVFQPANDTYRKRFPQAYKAFKNRTAENTSIVGLRIEMFPAISKAAALTLKSMNINTVEELAAVHDGNIDKIGHQGREWRTKAQAYLATAKDSAATMKIVQEKKALEATIETMKSQIADLLRSQKAPVAASADKDVVHRAAAAAADIQRQIETDIEADVVAAARRPRARASANA